VGRGLDGKDMEGVVKRGGAVGCAWRRAHGGVSTKGEREERGGCMYAPGVISRGSIPPISDGRYRLEEGHSVVVDERSRGVHSYHRLALLPNPGGPRTPSSREINRPGRSAQSKGGARGEKEIVKELSIFLPILGRGG